MALFDDRFWEDIRQGLTDAGNRGFVGGLLGAPVDMATGLVNAGLMAGGVLGNKLGLLGADQLPTPIQNPVGGSEWIGQQMQDAGMVSPNRNPTAETLAGLLGPVAINKGGRAVYQMEQNAAAPSPMNAATGNQAGAIVYHGSPYKFDAFDISARNQDAGGASFGRGINLSEDAGHAKAYGENLYTVDLPDKAIKGFIQWEAPVAKEISNAIPKVDLSKPIPFGGGAVIEPTNGGWLLRAGDAAFPISRSEVTRMFGGENTGEQVYRKLVAAMGGDESAASAWLRDRGVKGIVNNTERGVKNYTVFDAALPKIMGRE